jgi:protein involved in polysaccharide export with SLBB domain
LSAITEVRLLSFTFRFAAVLAGVLCLCLLPLSLAGCRGARVAVSPEVQAGLAEGYILRAGDQVSIDVFREPDLSGTFRLEASGAIRHPLFGVVEISGYTAAEAEARITDLLSKRYLVNPRVMIRVVSSQSSQVVILGEVKMPGVHAIPFDKPMTLLQAIGQAGGFTDLASINRVLITRSVEGRQKKMRVQVSRIIDGKEPDTRLEPNDVITVPQTLF